MKAQIKSFSKKFKSYGHWVIEVVADNPALLLSDDDYYWTMNNREDEPDTVTYRYTTTNSRAIDGHDGGDQALAEECVRACSEFDSDNFDLSGLSSGDEDQ